jgi:flagellar biogenesis protein FliO
MIAGAGVDYLRVVLSLLFCLALGIGAIFLARRAQGFRKPTTGQVLSVVESRRLDTRTSVHVVMVGDHQALVVCNAGGATIAWVPAQVATPGSQDGPA